MSAVVDPDSGSDEDCPKKETEFVIHMVDDHIRPPPPAHQPIHPLRPPPAVLPEQPRLDYNRRHKKLIALFVLRLVHFAAMLALGVTTVALVARLPKEFTDGVGGFYRGACPVFICFTTISWFIIGLLNNDEQTDAVCW